MTAPDYVKAHRVLGNLHEALCGVRLQLTDLERVLSVPEASLPLEVFAAALMAAFKAWEAVQLTVDQLDGVAS